MDDPIQTDPWLRGLIGTLITLILVIIVIIVGSTIWEGITQ